jgi:hypothetical protein
LQYNTDDDVEETNLESYVQRHYSKFENGGLKTMKRGESLPHLLSMQDQERRYALPRDACHGPMQHCEGDACKG